MKRLVISVVLIVAGAVTAQAMPRATPPAYKSFCGRYPAECLAATDVRLSHDARTMRLLNRINREVNATIRERPDRGDVWTLSPVAGDCEDYALTKRHRLVQAGLSAGALRMAIAITPQGAGHAVLIARTTAGDYLLDNLRRAIVKRQHSGYRFLKVSTADPTVWE